MAMLMLPPLRHRHRRTFTFPMDSNVLLMRRLCLSFIVSSFFLTISANASISSQPSPSPTSMLSPTPSASASTSTTVQPSSSASVVTRTKKKKRRRKKHPRDEPVPLPEYEGTPGAHSVSAKADTLQNSESTSEECSGIETSLVSSSVVERARKKKKKKKRRRKSLSLDEPALLPEQESISGALDDCAAIVEAGALQSSEAASEGCSGIDISHDVIAASPLTESGDETVATASIATIITSNSNDEGDRPTTKRKRKRRRRKVVSAEGVSTEDVQNNCEQDEVLLPILSEDDHVDAGAFQEGDVGMVDECLQSTKDLSQNSLKSETPLEPKESLSGNMLNTDSIPLDNLEEESLPPHISVSRNETTESMTIHDDSNPDAPATYEYTKHNEEETVEGFIHTDSSDESLSSTPTAFHQGGSARTTTFVRSSQQYENIQLTGGSTTGQTVNVKVSRQRKQQTVHIRTKKKPSSNASSKASKPKVTTARGSTGKGGECLRRIKREWKDAVKMGIAYDWTTMRTIRNPKKRQPSSDNNNNNSYVRIGPFGKNLLRWHFSVSGPANSVYENGIYHGRVLLPKDYPGSPPRVQMLTPSGRFVCGEDICLSASSYHPETWTPRWTVLALVDALRLHMLTTANEIGGVVASDERRGEYAVASRSWKSVGVVDHGRMVEEGMFPLRKSMEDDLMEGVEEEEEDDVVVVPAEKPMESSSHSVKVAPQQQHQSLPDGSMEQSSSPETRTKASKKQKKNHVSVEQPSVPENRTKSSKKQKKRHHLHHAQIIQSPITDAAKATKKIRSKAVAAQASPKYDAESSNGQKQQRGFLSMFLKRIIIEMLKLPLRILSVLLRILGKIESQLMAILDNL